MFSVYGLQGVRLGSAQSFGEARRMQEASLPADLAPYYAGINANFAPMFDADIPDNIAARYGIE